MKLVLAIATFFFIIFSTYAQVYEPIAFSDDQKEISKYLKSKSKDLKREFKSYPVKNGKIIRRFFKNRKELIKELTKENYLIVDNELETYLNTVLQDIAKSNGIDGKDLKVLITRDTSPNAYSLGEGTFVFNISLLSRLENEDQLYFIMAHELSHFILDHLATEISTRMAYSKSDEYKEKKRKIKKGKFNKYSRSIEEFKSFQYGNQYERRKRELAADSLGFALIKDEIQNPHNVISALQIIDSVSPSEISRLDLTTLKNHFSTASMPFKEEWTSGYDFSKYNYQRGKVDIFGVNKDSLVSHPEKQERILNLENAITQSKIELEENPKKDKFMTLRQKFLFEDVYAHYALEEYGRGIYLILQLRQTGNLSKAENIFYDKMLSLFYKELAESRFSLEFKKYVDQINYIHFTEEYRLFLTIIDKLSASELQELSKKHNIN